MIEELILGFMISNDSFQTYKDYTKYIKDFEWNIELGQIWQSVKLTIILPEKAYIPQKLDEAVIIYGNAYTQGYILSVENKDDNEYQIEMRNITARLDTPFQQKTEEILPARNARELLGYIGYASFYRPDILERIDFGGGYNLNGTYADALKNIAEIVGLRISPFGVGTVYLLLPYNQNADLDVKHINEDETIEIEELSTSENEGVGVVYVGDRDTSSLNRKCDIVVSPETGTVFFTVSPVFTEAEQEIVEYSGIVDDGTEVEEILLQDEYLSTIDGDEIELKGDIAEIVSIFVGADEMPPSMYETEYRLLRFKKRQYGVVSISYLYKTYKAEAIIKQSGKYKFVDVGIRYGASSLCRKMERVDDTAGQKVKVITPRENGTICRDKPIYEVYQAGQELDFQAYIKKLDSKTTQIHISEDARCSRVFTDKIEVERTATGEYIAKLGLYPEQILYVKDLAGNSIGYTANDRNIVLDAPQKTVEVSYKSIGWQVGVSGRYPTGSEFYILQNGQKVYSDEEFAEVSQAGDGRWHYKYPNTCNCRLPLTITHNIYDLFGIENGHGSHTVIIRQQPVGDSVAPVLGSASTEMNGDFSFNVGYPGDFIITCSELSDPDEVKAVITVNLRKNSMPPAVRSA